MLFHHFVIAEIFPCAYTESDMALLIMWMLYISKSQTYYNTYYYVSIIVLMNFMKNGFHGILKKIFDILKKYS